MSRASVAHVQDTPMMELDCLGLDVSQIATALVARYNEAQRASAMRRASGSGAGIAQWLLEAGARLDLEACEMAGASHRALEARRRGAYAASIMS